MKTILGYIIEPSKELTPDFSNEVLKSIESLQRFYKDSNEPKYYITSVESDWLSLNSAAIDAICDFITSGKALSDLESLTEIDRKYLAYLWLKNKKMPAKKYKIKPVLDVIGQFVFNAPVRPALLNVFLDKGKALATDGNVFLMTDYENNSGQEFYNPRLKEFPTAEKFPYKYPDYECIIPDGFQSCIDIDVLNTLTELQVAAKMNKWERTLTKINGFDSLFLFTDSFHALFQGFAQLGIAKVKMLYNGSWKAIKFQSGETLGLLMPVIPITGINNNYPDLYVTFDFGQPEMAQTKQCKVA